MVEAFAFLSAKNVVLCLIKKKASSKIIIARLRKVYCNIKIMN